MRDFAAISDLPKGELITNCPVAHLAHQKMNLDFILETQRAQIIAARRNARPSCCATLFVTMDGEPERTEKCMFRSFHHAKEIGEVNDPRHVGFRELNATRHLELVRHAAAT